MNKVHEQKYNFCRHELLQLIQAIDKDVLRLEYVVQGNCEEIATIVWLNTEREYRKSIYVTGDSLSSLTRDVLNCLN